MTRRVLRRRPDPMDATDALITQTANGSSIEKLADGQFRVCDNKRRCMLTSSLSSAEGLIRSMDQGYGFPYSSNVRRVAV
mgnify:FL=1